MTLLRVSHCTTYTYGASVRFGEHRILARPRDSIEQRLEAFNLRIWPQPAQVRWIHDVFGNCIAVARFETAATQLRIQANMVLDHAPDAAPVFEIDDRVRHYPFVYGPEDAIDLEMNVRRQFPEQVEVDHWARRFSIGSGGIDTGTLLMSMTQAIKAEFTYARRSDPGTQSPAVTLRSAQGTCRDFALLMMEAVRALGFAARFVTGYIYSPARDGDHRGGGATHAWCQVYLPGAGWVEFDPTNGIIGSKDLIRVGVSRLPSQAVPITGSFLGNLDDFIGMEVDVLVEKERSPQDGMG